MNCSDPMQVFAFESHALRTTMRSEEPWFIATDVASILGYRNASDMARMLDDDEKGTHIVRTLGGDQESVIISEPGLYYCIMRSRKPEAKAFKRWVTHEVLPSIRKTGQYVDAQAASGQDHAPQQGRWLSHTADRLVAADRIFRSGMRSARTAGLSTHQAIAVAADYCLRTTGVDLLEELRIPADCSSAPPPHSVQTLTATQFWQAFTQGELAGFPSLEEGLLLPAASTDVYALYGHWCRQSRAHQQSMNAFVLELRKHGVAFTRQRYIHCGVTKQATIASYMDWHSQGMDGHTRHQYVQAFREALAQYAHNTPSHAGR